MTFVLGIDPGLSGALVVTNGADKIAVWEMPVSNYGKEKEVSFQKTILLLKRIKAEFGFLHTYLERAMPLAMGSKHAFNYGRGFQTLILALEITKFPTTLVEPQKWAKEMHQGISQDLKPKAKSLIAVQRLYPRLIKGLPVKKTGSIHDGYLDALLIAGFGLRRLGHSLDFY